jgi:small subunit ribosomal protein S8
MIHDTIADMLTRIRNANAKRMQTVSMPMTRVTREIAAILQTEGWIDSWKETSVGSLMLRLKYRGSKQDPVLTGLRRVSRSGCRVYVTSKDVPKVLGGMGTAIVSTSQGIMTDRSARNHRLGGELICLIW